MLQGPPGIEQDNNPTLPNQSPLYSHRFALKSSSPAQVTEFWLVSKKTFIVTLTKFRASGINLEPLGLI